MEWTHVFHAVLSLIFVIGLLFLTVYIFKLAEQKGLRSRFAAKLRSGGRLNLIESRRLDAANTLFLVECDQTEYLILCGSGFGLLLKDKPAAEGANIHE